MDLTPFIRLASKRRLWALERMDVVRTQERVLFSLVKRAQHTLFGKDHSFSNIRSVEDFQKQVPIRQYEEFWGEYWKTAWPILDNVTWPGRIPFFAKTSGTTTGKNKFIPITRELNKASNQTGFDLMAHHLHHFRNSRPLSGKAFILAATTSLEEVAPNIFCGHRSGISIRLIPFLMKRNLFPSAKLLALSNWDERVESFSKSSLNQRITMMSGLPNWILVMLDRIRECQSAEGKIDGPTLPDLQLLIHGGVPFDFYKDRLEPHFAGSSVDKREGYLTSEADIAFADRGPGEGLRLLVDNKLFLEFIPLEDIGRINPRRHWMANIEKDVDYAVVLSNCAGLWAYLLGDVVRFVDTRPPRLLILGRVSQKLNVFGEHLITAEIEEAVQSAARQFRLGLSEYTVGPILPDKPGGTGYHVYILEPSSILRKDLMYFSELFSEHIDKVLTRNNYNYEAQRKGNAGIGLPLVRWVKPGTFEAWMRAKGKLGGQHKVPRVTPKGDLFTIMCHELGVSI